ncbi:DNA-binding response regulator [Butyrivibrio sp. X503]|uniref:response regulator transcription factor n=1 Tax=Butyrivibrio sp. X503 TaxID=2364878 RepID=UPI000EA8FA2F|nr:response regulator transcription factor [Butyrivibrio sp. X503]RKM58076.1 DNA-binding response regulator [Butyrivibrio sp. X503]
MEQILIVEDDMTLNNGLCQALKDNDRQIVSCESITEAKEQLLLGMVSLILLDINLPDGNGIDLLKEIKEKSPQIPVILLTANDTDKDIVAGLEQGADDYITKPFSLAVLRARVNTQLRKIKPDNNTGKYVDETFEFDYNNMIFTAYEHQIELSKTEQKLLRILTDNAGITVKREALIDRLWTDGAEYVDENALSVTVKRLRDKLSAQEKIKTIYGIGYSWVKENG